MLSRRSFLVCSLGLLAWRPPKQKVVTVLGEIDSSDMGITLVHEHFLVDFIGASLINNDRWNRDEVLTKILPFLNEAKAFGVKTILDCTPDFLGRDEVLLKMISEKSGIQVLTNTGYYAAVQYKYLPSWVYSETEEELASRWINEAKNGINGSGIKPGFIKISVNGTSLTELEEKLVKAAALTHLETGLTICSHTGPAIAAFEQIAILKDLGVSPTAFVWVHAQNEKNKQFYHDAARMGVWVSLDGMGWGDWDNYVLWLGNLKRERQLNRVLISHDAGWYDPAKPNGGEIKGYTNIFERIIPSLLKNGFKRKDIRQLLVKNPAEAFSVEVRRIFM